MHTKDSLVQFEQRVADAFAAKRIRAPVHLSSPEQADHLIPIFKDFRPGIDWLCSGWRNHMHCLLAGVPEDELFDAILAGRSMTYCSAKHRVICSSIVGGVLPIAAGLALAERMRLQNCPVCVGHGSVEGTKQVVDCPEDHANVYVMAGDMTSRTGLFHEFRQYCAGHSLPVVIVCENNGFSTNTPTDEVWGTDSISGRAWVEAKYAYKRTWPHVGIHERVAF